MTGKSSADYVATFDPSTSKVTKLQLKNFKYSRGLSVHGMDVVQSTERNTETLIYLVNHRHPLPPAKAEDVGADSVIEIFTQTAGSNEMRHIATYKDPVIATPNDILAVGDDASFYFTNDHGFEKTGFVRLSYRLLDSLVIKRTAGAEISSGPFHGQEVRKCRVLRPEGLQSGG